MKLPLWLLLVTGVSFLPVRGEELAKEGLLLDLDAAEGMEVAAEGGVTAWHNQAASGRARVFRPQDEGRKVAGSGRPSVEKEVVAAGGHDVVRFRRQELVNFEDDAFDQLTTGSGYTWFSVMAVQEQVPIVKDVNSFFGNLRNGKFYEGFWAGLTDDNRVWAGTRNGLSFGRWDENNPQLLGPKLEVGRFYVVAGRMGAGTGTVPVELFVNGPEPVARQPIRVNPHANPSRLAVGQERDATNHPGAESFDGEIARLLVYGRPLEDKELVAVFTYLKKRYRIR